MEEQKSSLIIFLLSLALALMLYFYFGSHLQQQQGASAKGNQTAESAKVEETPPKLAGDSINVETEKFSATVNTQGGILESLRLKRYLDDSGKPMELIPKGGFFWNISQDKRLGEKLNRAIFSVQKERDKEKIKLILTTSLDNQTYTKIYTFSEKEYRIGIKIAGPRPVGVRFGPRVAPKDREARYSFEGPLVYDGKKVREVKLKKKREETFDNPVWVALQSLYFTVTIIPQKPIKATIKKMGEKLYRVELLPKKDLFLSWGFAGPKKYDLLKSYGLKLEENIRFGMFGIISKPLLYLMNWLYSIIPNYGVAIIILTVLIKIIFHPLSVKGYKSMNKMKELQPVIQQIREAYKDDPNKMNQELMELYKKHKVNPFGGCLPLLLQIPVFFALYKLLMVSIELRHAPFILWITDLSAKDPYYVTPILMGLTMLIQQLLTPGQDPTQNKFMLVLPVVFTIIFLNFPSGLCLYFLVSNILSIIEQLMIKYVYS